MFRGLSLFHKIVFFINILAALLLLAACAVPHISEARLSFLSLGVPFLVGVNLLFFLFWLVQRKKQLFPSLLVLIFGYFTLGTFVIFNFSKDEVLEDDLSIMSYNVRAFNEYEEIDRPDVFNDIRTFVDAENPDIICFQEMGRLRLEEYENYPYRETIYPRTYDKVTLGIFSKFPIIKSEMIDFPRSNNSAAFADILYKNDTIRIYNVHLESLGITPGKGTFQNKSSDKLFKMLSKSFAKQSQQAEILEEHMKSSPYKQVLTGDFNNTQFSNVYQTVKGEKNDSFEVMGSGYGRTLSFHGVPIRIDFILADPEFQVKSHKNFDVKYSDHYPVMASFELMDN